MDKFIVSFINVHFICRWNIYLFFVVSIFLKSIFPTIVFLKLKWIQCYNDMNLYVFHFLPVYTAASYLWLLGRTAELSSIKREIPSLLAVVVAYKESRVNGGSNCRRSAALMIFDWPEVTSRYASQLVLIPSVLSPSTCSSLHYARSSRVHSHRRHFCSVFIRALCNCPPCRWRPQMIKLAVSCACFF